MPGTAAAVPLLFENIAGSMTGALLPTGNAVDVVDGVEATLIDNGMPCVVLRASNFGLAGQETREALEADAGLKARLEAIRRKAGPLMNLGEVGEKSVPKMTLVSAPFAGGAISTRSFIPHRVHASIGVLAAVSVATASRQPGRRAGEAAEGRPLPDRASDRRGRSIPRPRRRRHAQGRRHRPYRARALRRAGLSRPAR